MCTGCDGLRNSLVLLGIALNVSNKREKSGLELGSLDQHFSKITLKSLKKLKKT